MKVYIAGPFFNDAQIETIEIIKNLLTSLQVDFFSPKDECMFKKGVTPPKEILKMNFDAIESCDFMIAVTKDKDMGTLFECGFASAKEIPIIYFWENPDMKAKFNLMLSASAYSVVRNIYELASEIHSVRKGEPRKEFEGELE